MSDPRLGPLSPSPAPSRAVTGPGRGPSRPAPPCRRRGARRTASQQQRARAEERSVDEHTTSQPVERQAGDRLRRRLLHRPVGNRRPDRLGELEGLRRRLFGRPHGLRRRSRIHDGDGDRCRRIRRNLGVNLLPGPPGARHAGDQRRVDWQSGATRAVSPNLHWRGAGCAPVRSPADLPTGTGLQRRGDLRTAADATDIQDSVLDRRGAGTGRCCVSVRVALLLLIGASHEISACQHRIHDCRTRLC